MYNQHMNKQYDLIIIGAGPTGLIAGVIAKQRNLNFLIIDSNNKVGRKLAITGKGRCNITNYNTDLNDLIDQYFGNRKFLFHAFSEFSITDTIDFFNNELNIPTKVERGNRVFPENDKSLDITDSFFNILKDNLQLNTTVKEILTKEKQIIGVKTNKGTFEAKNYLLCTGGKSYPLTGSKGDGYRWIENLGHTVTKLKPALIPVITKENWIRDLAGLSLKNVRISIWQNNKKKLERFGEALFTHEGMSGPIIIDMSREIGELLENGKVKLKIDFKPALDFKTLDERILRDLGEANTKAIKNSLNKLLPKTLIPVMIEISNIDPNERASQLSKEERKSLLTNLKGMEITVDSLDSWDRAIVTAGGVNTREIDPKTMKSKIIDNLYIAGEILDIYGPTGGYNLQICWSTGVLVGRSIQTQELEKD